MTTSLTKINIEPREPLASEIARRLLAYLFSGEVKPGDRLPSERQFTEALGVNRPAVREALRALTFLGLLEVRHSSGTYFRNPDQDFLFNILELSLVFGQGRMPALTEARAELEVIVAGFAAAQRTDADVTELQFLLTQMRKRKGVEGVEIDIDFHSKIAEISGNDVLRDMLKGIRSVQRSLTEKNMRAATSAKAAYDQHLPIFEAIRDHDPQAASHAMREHMLAAVGATKAVEA